MIVESLLRELQNMKGKNEMELISVKIEGFKNIESAYVEFEGITSLVSANSYGKSNFFEAVDFAADFIQANQTNKGFMMSMGSFLPLNRKIDDKNFVAEFVFVEMHQGKRYFIKYGFEFVWIRNDNEGMEIVKEWLDIKSDERYQQYRSLISRNSIECKFKSSESGRCSNPLKIEKNELAINKLLSHDSLYYLWLLQGIHNINIYVDKHLDASTSYRHDPLILATTDEFNLSAPKGIPRLVYFLKEKYPEKYSLLKDSFLLLFPSIKDLFVSELDNKGFEGVEIPADVPFVIANKFYSISVIDANINQPIPFQWLSDGAKRIFLILANLVVASIRGIQLVAIEEPENSIHPSLLRSFLSILSQLSEDSRIVISSHSPYILQYVKTDSIYIGKPNPNSLAEFKRIDKKKIKGLYNDASTNDSVGNYIFELLSGSEDDIELLTSYLEK